MRPRVPLSCALGLAVRRMARAALPLLLPLGAAAAQEPTPPARPPGDDVLAAIAGTPEARARADSAAAAQRRFLLRWRDAWFATEDARRPAGYATEGDGDGPVARRMSPARAERFFRNTPARLRALHCHGDGSAGVGVLARMVPSMTSPRAYCPGWLPESAPPRPDESLVLDSALAPERRAGIAAERGRIIALLDSAAEGVPRSDWLTGQRVRLRVDAVDLDGALAVARACTGSPAWCAMLAGWVHARRGEVPAADSAFAAASAALPAPARCVWEDARLLLDSLGRRVYAALGCGPARDSANARLWWLADPLYAEPGNERRVAHHARQVEITLRAALGVDERHDWAPDAGGDALAETMTRYGWPSYQLWGGTPHDSGHTRWIESLGGRGSAPYATLEYRHDRAHVVPAWRAVGDPFAAGPDAWTLHAPPDAAHDAWWPTEHYARRAGPLAQLPDWQAATMRRHAAAVLAVAVDLDTATLRRAPGRAVPAALLLGRGPHDMATATEATAPAGGRVVLAAPVLADSALVAVEVAAGEPGTAARTRFGLAAPPPLAALAAGELAVSEPMLVDPGAAGDALPDVADVRAALARMLGTTRLRGVRRLGVYWESYGVAPRDTVEVAVRVVRDERSGPIRRLATALRLADDPSGSVAVRWREPRGAPAPGIADGPVPIQPRTVVLDVSRLAPGDYLLEVSVGRPGQPPATARRALTIESP